MSMKNSRWTILALCLAVAALITLPLLARERYEEKFQKTEALPKDGRVVLVNVSGTVEVRSAKEDVVRIDALKRSEASSLDKAKENAAQVTIEIVREGSTLRIETKYPKTKKFWGSDSLNVSVDYKVSIPEKASIDLRNISGSAELLAIGGALKAEVVSGNLVVRGATAGCEAKVTSGGLEVFDVVGDAYLTNTSGEITAARIKGSVEAGVVSGTLDIREVTEARSISGQTVSGNCYVQAKILPQARISLKTHSGDLRLVLPADTGFELDASCFSGVIESEFPVTAVGKISARQVRGTVGGGGASVNLKAFSGNIELRKG
ncbi:MAG: DUF4097 domain-containing protein [Candidatus Aminicenantes bacterium]|nr:DUF4097 domain-containing protein [Candidatus Aminicenantes bacterium]